MSDWVDRMQQEYERAQNDEDAQAQAEQDWQAQYGAQYGYGDDRGDDGGDQGSDRPSGGFDWDAWAVRAMQADQDVRDQRAEDDAQARDQAAQQAEFRPSSLRVSDGGDGWGQPNTLPIPPDRTPPPEPTPPPVGPTWNELLLNPASWGRPMAAPSSGGSSGFGLGDPVQPFSATVAQQNQRAGFPEPMPPNPKSGLNGGYGTVYTGTPIPPTSAEEMRQRLVQTIRKQDAFKHDLFNAIGFTPYAQWKLSRVPLDLQDGSIVTGGGGLVRGPYGPEIKLDSSQYEGAVHEYAHAWFDIGLTPRERDEFETKFLELAANSDPKYQEASWFAKNYVKNGQNKSDTEHYASLASYLMGNIELLPDSLLHFYTALFTGQPAMKADFTDMEKGGGQSITNLQLENQKRKTFLPFVGVAQPISKTPPSNKKR